MVYERSPPATHCRRGHAMTDDNVKVRSDGYRVCLTCQRATKARWSRNQARKRKGLPPEAPPPRGQFPIRRPRRRDDGDVI